MGKDAPGCSRATAVSASICKSHSAANCTQPNYTATLYNPLQSFVENEILLLCIAMCCCTVVMNTWYCPLDFGMGSKLKYHYDQGRNVFCVILGVQPQTVKFHWTDNCTGMAASNTVSAKVSLQRHCC